jgi:hypothetical protein
MKDDDGVGVGGATTDGYVVNDVVINNNDVAVPAETMEIYNDVVVPAETMEI